MSITLTVQISKKKDILGKIIKRLETSVNDESRIGFFDGEMHPSGNPVATIAMINDVGSITNPPRPFMSLGLKSILRSNAYRKMYADYLRKILSGKITLRAAYDQIGKFAVEDLKQLIDDWTNPPNSAKTIAIKGRNDPLVDTGTMLNSVKHKIAKSRKSKRSQYRRPNLTRVR